MIVEFPKAKTAYSRAARSLAASRPRRSKNGTPEERAAKAAPVVARVVIPRRSKNGTPEERAAKKAAAEREATASAATVIDVTSRLGRRAAAKRATMGATLTKEEMAAFYKAAPPSLQAIISAEILRAVEGRNDPPPDQPA
jgi:hypothetical protein